MSFFIQPIFLIVLCMMTGSFLGSLSFKKFKLGSSMSLFVGLFVSFILSKNSDVGLTIPRELFNVVLMGFIVAVGLKASKNIRNIIGSHGIKFIILSFLITSVGAVSAYIFTRMFPELAFSIIGSYEGGLTSSPGLATALEVSPEKALDAAIGLGYSIAYVPGIVVVMIYSSWMGKKDYSNQAKRMTPIDSTIKYPFIIWKFLFVIFSDLC